MGKMETDQAMNKMVKKMNEVMNEVMMMNGVEGEDEE